MARPFETTGAFRLGEVLDFMRLLWAMDHGLHSVSKRMRSALGVTGPQRLAIRIIGRFPGVSAGQIASVLHMHPSTLTGILKRLERGGVVRRRLDPADGRRALFTLTARGKSLDELRAGTVEQAVRRVLQRTPRARLLAAQEVLAAIAQELDSQKRGPGTLTRPFAPVLRRASP
ncbi:MAG: MarR family winged helix-turn-helix transcriptional regulator [Myxococcota bacterium]